MDKAENEKTEATKQVIDSIEQTKKANAQIKEAKKLVAEAERQKSKSIKKLEHAQNQVESKIKNKLKE